MQSKLKNGRTEKLKNLAAVLFLSSFVLWFFSFSVAQEAQEEAISLDLKNIETVELLRLLSLKTGKTIVPSARITGRIALFINNIKFEDVLDIILLTQGLSLDKKGNIYYLMTNAEYKALYGRDYFEPRDLKTIKLTYAKPANVFNALSQLKSDIGKIIADESTGTVIIIDIPEKLAALEKAAKELDQPLATAVYDLNYANAADAKAHITQALTPGAGEVIVDERTGKAIITDLPKKMEKLGRMVKELDTETLQVFIETDIVEITLSDKWERGIDWQKIFSDRLLDDLTFAGTFPQAAITSAFQRISVGTLATNRYEVTLDFLETYGDLKVISQPRLAVLNNTEAVVMVGIKDAFITATSSTAGENVLTAESIEYVDIGTKFTVTPTINREGFITMKLKAEISSALTPLTTTSGSRVPIISTSEAETTVKVKDGIMIMIAGLMKEEHSDSIAGLPILSRIPIIGALFSNRAVEKSRSELIIFITPRLMRGDLVLAGTEPERVIPEDIMPADLKKNILKEKKMSQAITELAVPGLVRESEEEGFIKEIEDDARLRQAEKALNKARAQQESVKTSEELEQTKKILEETRRLLVEAKQQQAMQPETKEIVKSIIVEKEKPMEKAEEAKLYFLKGLELQKSKNWEKVKENFNKAIELDPTKASYYNQLGIIFDIEGKKEEAEEKYLEAIEVDPGHLPAYSNLALLNEEMGNTQEAIKYWKKRIELGKPDDPWVEEALIHLQELK